MPKLGGPNSQFELDMAKSLKKLSASIQYRTDRITAILTEAYTSPKVGAKYWNDVRRKLDVQYKALEKIYSEWALINIPVAYRKSVSVMMKRLNKSKDIASRAKKSYSSLVTSPKSRDITAALYKDAIADWVSSLTTGQSNLNRITRATQQGLAKESFIDQSVARAIESGNIRNNTFFKSINMSDTLAGNLRGALEVIDGEKYVIAGSRRFKPKYYAEMVTRVKFHEAQAFGAIQTAGNYGTSLVQVSNHNTTTPICQKHENKIYSINGKDKRFPVLSTVPPFHVNCLHLLFPVFDTALEVTGTLDEWTKFSNNESKSAPNKGFTPIDEREVS